MLTKMEELQDTVKTVKSDVLKHHISPRHQVLNAVKADVVSLANEPTSLKDHITTVEPMWEEELRLIMEEQQFLSLSHQEELLADLPEDHKAILEIYGHVEKLISLWGSGAGRASRKSRQLAKQVIREADPGSLSNVMAEIRGARSIGEETEGDSGE